MMAHWQRTTPDAGDTGAIRRAAGRRAAWADELTLHTASPLRDVATDAADGSWRGRAATAFAGQAAQLPGLVSDLVARLHGEADALGAYADSIDRIAEEATALRQRLAAQHAAIARSVSELAELQQRSGTPDADEAQRLRTARTMTALAQDRHGLTALDARWDELAEERRAADAACAEGLRPPAPPPIGAMSVAQLRALTDAQLATSLVALTPLQLAELLRSDPAFAARLAAMRDPAAVAAWWRSLGSDDPAAPSALQEALVALAPATLGNLDGIAYWARDASNRAVLTAQLHELDGLTAAVVQDAQQGGRDAGAVAALLARHGFADVDQLVDRIAALRALRASLAQPGVPTQLITMLPAADGAHQPLAAISVGDLDAADRVTVAVPGMGSTVASTMRSWTADADNLYTQQRYLMTQGYAPTERVAVVAWIGYDAPAMPPSIEVLSSAKAEVGAAHLASFLQGVTASHQWGPGQNLSVVAHSYGTTTASIALEHTPVENFTMLASAGLNPDIATAGALQVEPGHVWASQSSVDLVAPIGRGESVRVDLPGGGGWVPMTPSTHPVNPADPAFGARVFTSEDVVWHGTAYAGSDGHDVSPQVEHALDHTTGYDYGYLDRGTISLRNTAETSLGLSDVATAHNTTSVPMSPAAVRELEDGTAPPLLPANFGLPWGPPA